MKKAMGKKDSCFNHLECISPESHPGDCPSSSIPPYVHRRDIALDIDDEYLVISAFAISVDDLVRIGRFLGVID
jgi:hypothetical protein